MIPLVDPPMDEDFFNFNEGIEIVYGWKRAAIYDLNSGRIYSIDESGANLLRLLEKNASIPSILESGLVDKEILSKFLIKLQDAQIGAFSGEPSKQMMVDSPTAPPTPKLKMVWFELTAKCNLRCIHCYEKRDRDKSNDELLTTQLWKRAVEECRLLGCNHISYVGGEPFLKPVLLKELVEYARKKGISSQEICSNGTLINQEDLDALISMDIYFAFSIFSLNADIHDAITTVSGSLEKTLKTVDYLAKKTKNLRLSVIAMKQNEFEYEKTINDLKTRYPDITVDHDITRPVGGGASENIITPSLKKACYYTEPDFPGKDKDEFWRNHMFHSCLGCKITIASDGSVFPCVMFREKKLGKLPEQSINEIINSKETLALWELSKEKVKECDVCEYRYACFDCPPRTIGLGGRIDEKPPNCLYLPRKGKWRSG
jgi:radical SAM protein with 4Fe4S-binding SPASM domain